MKEFNLELAKAGHKVRTADGAGARIICFDRDSEYNVDEKYPIVALVRVAGIEKIVEYTNEGVARQIGYRDLVMAPTKKEGWVNLYKDSNGAIICKFHNTKEDALLLRCEDYIATTKIEWEE